MNKIRQPPDVQVSFIDVGFGDCTAVLDRENNQALVMDCPPWGVETALSTLEGFELDTVIVSHLDLDHFGGIAELLRRLGGCRVFRMAPVVSLDNAAKIKIKAFVREINLYLRQGASSFTIRAGDDGYLGNVRWRCLSPGLMQELGALVSTNNRASVVLGLDLGTMRVLVGSDADSVVWRDLIDEASEELRADVFRYPHHGSPLTGGPGRAALNELLGVVRPSHVILSIGERARYGHPRAEVISDLKTASCHIMCTRSTSLCNNGQRSDQPCAGTVSVDWTPTSWRISPSEEKHTLKLQSLPTPACRAETGNEDDSYAQS
jgi:competence protein ComEC